jgi:hypothetical protein
MGSLGLRLWRSQRLPRLPISPESLTPTVAPPVIIAPAIERQPPHEVTTLAFSGTASASSVLTLAGNRIPFRFRVREVIIDWPIGTNKLLQVKVFVATDAEAPSTGEPTGTNIISPYGQRQYLVGSSGVQRYPIFYETNVPGLYVKVYGNNTDTSDHALDVRVVIERI